MRTSILDIVRLSWAIYRCPARRWLRIGQLLKNASQQPDPAYTYSVGRASLFYQENRELTWHVREFVNRVNRTPPKPSGDPS